MRPLPGVYFGLIAGEERVDGTRLRYARVFDGGKRVPSSSERGGRSPDSDEREGKMMHRSIGILLLLVALSHPVAPAQTSGASPVITQFGVGPDVSARGPRRHSPAGAPHAWTPRRAFGSPGAEVPEARLAAVIAREASAAAARPWWRYPLIGAGIGSAAGAATALYFIAGAMAVDDPIFDPYLVVGLPVALGAAGGGLVGVLAEWVAD